MTLSHSLSRLSSARILVVGDLMLDSYTFGEARRISPEAPVPVIHARSVEERPGGAGNVALGLRALGAEVAVLGRIGGAEGERVKALLEKAGIDTSGLIREKGYTTAVKNRILAGSQQICRVDFETVEPLSCEGEVLVNLDRILSGVSVVAISDYGKGFLTPTLLKALFSRGLITLTDPKGVDYTRYRGTTLIKPNYSEALHASGLESSASLESIGGALLHQTGAEELVITRSSKGMCLLRPHETLAEFPVQVKQVTDVTGAGDTVLAVLALAKASGLSAEEGCQLANLAAGVAVERLGCAQVTLGDIAGRLLDYHVDGKVFDPTHLFPLKQALQGKKICLLSLSPQERVGPELIRALGHAAKAGELVVRLGDEKPTAELEMLLNELQTVKYILPASVELQKCLEELKPSTLYGLVNGNLQKIADAALSV
ncbi:MAG: HldE protein [Chlamydiia bacterium]|nr:HldE protein [Chlamydiia bacterium]